MKHKKIVVTVGVLTLSLLVFLMYPRKIGTINKQAVSLEELMTYALKNENNVAQAFSKEHNITSYGKSFWLESYDGQKPIHDLYETAISDLVRHRAILNLALDLKLVDDVSFQSEKQGWQDSKNGLSLWQYLEAKDYQMSDQIKEELLKAYPPREGDLEKAFDALDDKYKRTDFGVDLIIFEGVSNSDLEPFLKDVPASNDVEVVIAYWKEHFPIQYIESMRIETKEIHKEDLYKMSLSESVAFAENGDVVEGYSKDQVIYVMNKEGGEYLTLETAPRFAEVSYVNALYETMIQEAIDASEISLTRYAEKKFMENYE